MSKFKLIILLLCLAALTSGCIKIKTGKEETVKTNDAGIFKTVNKGDAWKQQALIAAVGGKQDNFTKVGVSSLAIDPSDHLAIYCGSENSGLLYSYDGAGSWTRASGLAKATIQAVAIDPENKCAIYAAIGNKVYKSTDCSRTWEQVFIDTDPKLVVLSIAIDLYNPENIYIGTSRGELIQSSNRGQSWTTRQRLGGQLSVLVIDPNDSRNLFAAVDKKGLFRSKDRGVNMASLKDSLKDFSNTKTIKDIAMAKDSPGLVFIATGYGILKSGDYGETWENIELIPPEKKTDVNSIAVNPKDTGEIFYVTDNAFYRTNDGGAAWTPKKLPSSRAGLKLIIDQENPEILYLGVKGVPEK